MGPLHGPHLVGLPPESLHACGYCEDVGVRWLVRCGEPSVSVLASTRNRGLYPVCEEHLEWALREKRRYLLDVADQAAALLDLESSFGGDD